ncbi:hypothetical protein SAMN05216428_105196 [Nitrosospira sp. Nsp11]|uniref:hypothetical protein n=1 Tax=Nitrosospira sp. Nsp11 TaxID=1855338 RepID=UPI00091D5FFD|nr:hypothetical protein [Nitrosospira sp. Nsp11]SHL74311.1 hypothetical protein SAMN05216428_105196 [Nitrosospira sp. Nsp11]
MIIGSGGALFLASTNGEAMQANHHARPAVHPRPGPGTHLFEHSRTATCLGTGRSYACKMYVASIIPCGGGLTYDTFTEK